MVWSINNIRLSGVGLLSHVYYKHVKDTHTHSHLYTHIHTHSCSTHTHTHTHTHSHTSGQWEIVALCLGSAQRRCGECSRWRTRPDVDQTKASSPRAQTAAGDHCLLSQWPMSGAHKNHAYVSLTLQFKCTLCNYNYWYKMNQPSASRPKDVIGSLLCQWNKTKEDPSGQQR